MEPVSPLLCRYEGLFDYPYILPKLDILALPNYAFQAMENWGLLVFTQERIEIDPAGSPFSERCWGYLIPPLFPYKASFCNAPANLQPSKSSPLSADAPALL